MATWKHSQKVGNSKPYPVCMLTHNIIKVDIVENNKSNIIIIGNGVVKRIK